MKFLLIGSLVLLVSFYLLEANINYQMMKRVKITKYDQFDSILVRHIEKINGLASKYFHNREVWLPVSHQAAQDFCPMPLFDDGFTKIPKVIKIDRHSQYFGAYENGQLVYWGPVVTGRGLDWTPAGSFKVINKYRRLISRKYNNTPMPYALQIFNNICIHQGEMVGRRASHGCIRLLEYDARWLYEWSLIGTKVVII